MERNRLKRRFEALAKGKGIPANAQTARQSWPTGTSYLISTSTHPVPQFDSTSTNESDASNRDESLNNNPPPGREFRDIIDYHQQLVVNDNDGELGPLIPLLYRQPHIPLSLFLNTIIHRRTFPTFYKSSLNIFILFLFLSTFIIFLFPFFPTLPLYSRESVRMTLVILTCCMYTSITSTFHI